MPAITATAPGKTILFGEHAVVYGRPAIAVPVHQVRARAVVTAEPRWDPGKVRVQAPQIGLEAWLDDLPQTHPIIVAVGSVNRKLGISHVPACTLRITSTIPIAAGLGSGAATAVACIRAYSTFLGKPLSDELVSELAFEVEKIHHGTPSGIDNTVVTYALPVYFVRGEPLEILEIPGEMNLVIADSGIPSPTSIAISDVRNAWISDPVTTGSIFDEIGAIAESARECIRNGQVEALGELMDSNHAYLQRLCVSCEELDKLVSVARSAGALGAKLSGGGRGGNMIALVTPASAQAISKALLEQGAVNVITTSVKGG